jgi:hypothetical protein
MSAKKANVKPKVFGGYAQRASARPRKKRPSRKKAPLNIERILQWADAEHNRTGCWPKGSPRPGTSSPVHGAIGETWRGINAALSHGCRGLPGGSSLARLLAKHRGVRNQLRLPKFSVAQILAWADAHFKRHREWPKAASEAVFGTQETWCIVHGALARGTRGLPGGSSLARLLAEHRGVRNPQDPPRLTVDQILEWADAYHERTDSWPRQTSGPVYGVVDETWAKINASLRKGLRGLPGGSSLAQLLAERRGLRNMRRLSSLSTAQILKWADAHFRRHGDWPKRKSGAVDGAPETWHAIEQALAGGRRGLPGGSSLPRLFAEHRGVRNPRASDSPRLTTAQILEWADAHYRRTKKWPAASAGPVLGTDRENWREIDWALCQGRRGLRGGRSLSRFLLKHRGQHAQPNPFEVGQSLPPKHRQVATQKL